MRRWIWGPKDTSSTFLAVLDFALMEVVQYYKIWDTGSCAAENKLQGQQSRSRKASYYKKYRRTLDELKKGDKGLRSGILSNWLWNMNEKT